MTQGLCKGFEIFTASEHHQGLGPCRFEIINGAGQHQGCGDKDHPTNTHEWTPGY